MGKLAETPVVQREPKFDINLSYILTLSNLVLLVNFTITVLKGNNANQAPPEGGSELNHGKSYRKGPLNHNGATKDLVES
jgi:hypothetical protein